MDKKYHYDGGLTHSMVFVASWFIMLSWEGGYPSPTVIYMGKLVISWTPYSLLALLMNIGVWYAFYITQKNVYIDDSGIEISLFRWHVRKWRWDDIKFLYTTYNTVFLWTRGGYMRTKYIMFDSKEQKYHYWKILLYHISGKTIIFYMDLYVFLRSKVKCKMQLAPWIDYKIPEFSTPFDEEHLSSNIQLRKNLKRQCSIMVLISIILFIVALMIDYNHIIAVVTLGLNGLFFFYVEFVLKDKYDKLNDWYRAYWIDQLSVKQEN